MHDWSDRPQNVKPRSMAGDDLNVADRRQTIDVPRTGDALNRVVSPQDQFYLAATELCLLASRYLSQLIEEDDQDDGTTASQSWNQR
jgi:hypothetical protein